MTTTHTFLKTTAHDRACLIALRDHLARTRGLRAGLIDVLRFGCRALAAAEGVELPQQPVDGQGFTAPGKKSRKSARKG